MFDERKLRKIIEIIYNMEPSSLRIARMPSQCLEEVSLVVSCYSKRRILSLIDRIIFFIKKYNGQHFLTEGTDNCNWVILDLYDLVIHVMLPEVLDYYDLDNFWKFLKMEDIQNVITK